VPGKSNKAIPLLGYGQTQTVMQSDIWRLRASPLTPRFSQSKTPLRRSPRHVQRGRFPRSSHDTPSPTLALLLCSIWPFTWYFRQKQPMSRVWTLRQSPLTSAPSRAAERRLRNASPTPVKRPSPSPMERIGTKRVTPK
jgi:hypothetical protein